MKYVNNLENIEFESIEKIYLDGVCKNCDYPECYEENSIPCLVVNLNDDKQIKHELANGFQVHECNEFLHSLNLMEGIQFITYPLYDVQVNICNKLLKIRRLMENVTGQKYDDIGILAHQVYSCILDTLLAKHHLASTEWEQAMQKRPLEEWVKEAIEYLK